MAKSPIRPADAPARTLARRLLKDARHGALAVTHPETGAPHISRIALALTADGIPMSLISTLALHTTGLQKNPACALLIGEPPGKGDPLAFPRLSISATARFIPRDQDAALRAFYRRANPKSGLYIDFADFGFVIFQVLSAALNGGFGKAFSLSPADLVDPAERPET